MNYRRLLLGVVLVSLAGMAGAAELGDIARTLTAGGGILKKLMWAACIVVGIMLIATAFTQFQIHRRNPKLVPLTTPVMYLVLGIVSIAIPFIDTMSGFLDSKVSNIQSTPDTNVQQPANQQQYYDPNDIDAPIY